MSAVAQFEIFDVLSQKLGDIVDEVRSRLPLHLNSQFRTTEVDLDNEGALCSIKAFYAMVYILCHSPRSIEKLEKFAQFVVESSYPESTIPSQGEFSSTVLAAFNS